MSGTITFLIILAIGIAAFVIGKSRAVGAAAAARGQKAHSRSHYHGAWAFLLATLPALALVICWSIGASTYQQREVANAVRAETGETAHTATTLVNSLANALTRLDGGQATNPPQTMAELTPLLQAKGATLASDTQDYMIPIAVRANATKAMLGWVGGIAAILLSLAGAVYGLSQIAVRAPARPQVEKVLGGPHFNP